MASRMSSARNRHSLGGNHRLAENPVAELRFERCVRHQLDRPTETCGKLALQSQEFEQAHGATELDKQIHVAVFSAFIPGERTEERQPGDAEGVQQWTIVSQCLEDVLASGRY